MHELFIYYRAKASDAAALQAAVVAMQAALRTRHPGLDARLLRRPEPVDGLITWMETYALPATNRTAGADAALRNDIESAAAEAVVPLSASPRHVEVFEACA